MSQVPLPRTVSIGGKQWRIRRRYAPAGDACGLCDWDAGVIYISPKLVGQDLVDTIIHEFNHAITGRRREKKTHELGTVTARYLKRAGLI